MLKFKVLKSHPLVWIITLTSLIFFLCSSIRHLLFQSTAFEMGIYDQVAYLISQGIPPISSFLEIHHLGNHAAWAMYPIGILYKIYPSVYWLLLIQAICLALGAWPSWSLAKTAGLNQSQSFAIVALYLLYPVVFNINLFDFHPEVMAIPALLAAILAARLDQILWFSLAIIWVLGCKDALSLTIAAMGVWLFFFEKRRRCGTLALFIGVAWFIIVTQGIIPHFKAGLGPGGVGRYRYLGDSVFEIIQNLFLKPHLILNRVFSLETLEYLALITGPVIWWLSPQQLAPFISVLPVLATNILSDIDAQRDLIHQYSLPIVPFFVIAVIASLKSESWNLGLGAWHFYHKINPQKTPLTFPQPPIPKLIILWSFISFLALAKYGYFGSTYLASLDTWQATQEAISLIQTQGNVLTTAYIAPHVTHRPIVKLTSTGQLPENLAEFEYVLLNLRHPGWNSDSKFARDLAQQLKNNSQFQLRYQREEVYLFERI